MRGQRIISTTRPPEPRTINGRNVPDNVGVGHRPAPELHCCTVGHCQEIRCGGCCYAQTRCIGFLYCLPIMWIGTITF